MRGPDQLDPGGEQGQEPLSARAEILLSLLGELHKEGIDLDENGKGNLQPRVEAFVRTLNQSQKKDFLDSCLTDNGSLAVKVEMQPTLQEKGIDIDPLDVEKLTDIILLEINGEK